MVDDKKKNEALEAEEEYKTAVEDAYDYLENFDLLETITNVGNDEVFTPRKTADMLLDSLPEEVWHNPNYKWLNPATKNGIFEREIAIRLDDGLKDIIPDDEKRRKHILQNMIYSIGQTKFTANVARRTLYYCSQANRKCDGIKASDGHYVNGYSIGNGSWFDDEEGNIKTPTTDHDFIDSSNRKMPISCSAEARKKYHCKFCGISGSSSYNDMNQLEKYSYDFIHYKENYLEKALQEKFFGGNKNMKFDIIIGNPPYQLSDGGGTGDSAKPIYNLFIDQARYLKPKYLCMIIPSRWMKGGKGLDDFRKSMIEDTRIRKIFDFEDWKVCFPNNHIDGGVCYFVWDRDYKGKVDYHYQSSDGTVSVSQRYLKTDSSNTVIRDYKQLSILDKISKLKEKKFSEIVYSRNPYGFNSDFFNRKEEHPNIVIEKNPFNKSVKIYGVEGKKGGSKRVYGYIQERFVGKLSNTISDYKLLFSKAFTTTATVPPEVIQALPGEICTETFLLIGTWKTQEEQKNCLSYIKTKFFRALLLYNRHSLNISKESFDLIPMQDFSKKWSDKELYEKYSLSDDDIQYIENNIGEMN